VPARVKAYLLAVFFAVGGVVICVAWSQVGLMGADTDSVGPRVLGLGAFWGALAVLASAAFSAIDLRASRRRAASLGLFLLPAVITLIGLAIGRAETAVVGIFLLAAVVCAAFLPSVSQLTEQQLVVLPLTVSAGVIGIYPVAIGLARPSLAGFRSSGAPLPVIFAVAGFVAIIASLTCARLIAFRAEHAVQGGSSAAAQRGTLGATRPGTPPAGRESTAADQHLPKQELPPPHARPCTAVELPRQKPARHENDDQPGAPEPPHQ
jgi:hypothetical protein